MRQLNQVEFIKAGATHSALFPRCLDLVNRTQGRGIFPADYFAQCASQPDRFLLLAILRGELIGVASARVLAADASAFYAPFGQKIIALFQENRVGSLESASVHESWQGCGIGREMSRQRIAWLEEMGCNAIVGISWNSGRRHTSDRVFDRLGFRKLSQVKDFYAGISVQRNFICPVCGPPPCRCSATLYVKGGRTK